MDFDELNNYLQEEYYELKDLADNARVRIDRVIELVEMQIIPPHSYEVTQNTSIYCNIKGIYLTKPIATKYYNTSIVAWIQNAELLTREKSLSEIATYVREQFNQEFKKAMVLSGTRIITHCKSRQFGKI